jgi:hypothetical protein
VANEALGVSGIGNLQDARSLEVDGFGASEVDGGRRVEADTRMAVVVVVPPEEAFAEGAAYLQWSRSGRGTLVGT